MKYTTIYKNTTTIYKYTSTVYKYTTTNVKYTSAISLEVQIYTTTYYKKIVSRKDNGDGIPDCVFTDTVRYHNLENYFYTLAEGTISVP